MSSKITYRQQYTRCGKQRCLKCKEGSGHGPYWYAYWGEKGRTVSKYIGIHLPPDIAEEQQKPLRELQTVDRDTPVLLLRVYLLGQFRVEYRRDGSGRGGGGESIWREVDNRTWHRRRARALLGCLLSSPGRRLSREQAMEYFWPDLEVEVAANRLNGAVHELRQILEPEIERPAKSQLLRLEHDVLELAGADQIWVDAEAFENCVKAAGVTNHPIEAERLLEEAAALYRGDYLLEELYSEWAALRRDALQRIWGELLLALAQLRIQRDALVSALELLERLRLADPVNETALQQLMILLTRLDRRGEALQAYNQHVIMLQKDHEGEPLPETSWLYDQLCRGYIPDLLQSKPRPVIKPAVKHDDGKDIHTAALLEPLQESSLEEASSKEPLPTETSFTRPTFQLVRHNQGSLVGRDRDIANIRQVLYTIEELPAQHANTGENEEAMRQLAAHIPSRTKRSHFLLLTGEPGIGKTRLAEEVSIEAYTRGWVVAWGKSYQQDAVSAYRPWIELARTLLNGTQSSAYDDSPLASPPKLTDGSTILSPSSVILERLGALPPLQSVQTAYAPNVPDYSMLVPPHEQEHLHLWEMMLALLELWSNKWPLLLVLDDLHWADQSSIELLTYLAHHLKEQRVLIVGTCRNGELAPAHKLSRLVADMQRDQDITALPLQPLTQAEIGSMLVHLPDETVQSIQAQAKGNPFFAKELAGAIEGLNGAMAPAIQQDSTGNVSYPTHPVVNHLPASLAAVFEQRLSGLSTECQTLLGKAATLRGSFQLSQLLPLAGEFSEDTILDLLEEALRAGLLTEEGIGAQIRYDFWHPLMVRYLSVTRLLKASHTSKTER